MLRFTNALVVDGTGGAPRAGEVLVRGGRIEAVLPSAPALADCSIIDCTGLAVAPGFIDAHSHSDLHLLHRHPTKTNQGVTAEIVGNCGFSAFPSGHRAAEVREYGNAILCGQELWEWPTARDYLRDAAAQSTDCHVMSLVGHGTLRTAVAGSKQGVLTSLEQDQLFGLLRESLEGGAIGISTGLMYAPGSSAPYDELLAICRLAAKLGKIYTTHMRSYADDLLSSIEEQLILARDSGCRLQISHLQAVGRRNWDKQTRALELLERARREGIDVEFDSYPYLAGSTVMTQLLPQWVLSDGTSALVQRLLDGAVRPRILAEMKIVMPQQWNDIVIAGVASPPNQQLIGRTIEDVAMERSVDPGEFVLDLLVEEQGRVSIVSFNQSEKNLRELLTHPLCTVISDGVHVQGRPHPRLHGTFPEFLGNLCREKRWLSLAQAIYQITGKPAGRFGLAGRGRIAAGYSADLVLFDVQSIASRATYDRPEQSPMGIKAVYREGRPILRRLSN